jgi:hypothetical protein
MSRSTTLMRLGSRALARLATKRVVQPHYVTTCFKGMSTQVKKPVPKDEDEAASDIYHLKYIEEAKATFAVDAPDGETDWHLKLEMEEIKHIIDDAAVLEDAAAIQAKHDATAAFAEETKHTLAVDAPDGETDWHVKQEKLEINHIIDETANFEDPAVMEKKHKMEENVARTVAKTFAVDAPDGESDGHGQEELYEIKHIIDDASKVEDAAEINLRHQADQKIRQMHSRDAEHDW